jgi:hypothetical protein
MIEELLSRYFSGILSDEEKVVLFEKMEADVELKKPTILQISACNGTISGPMWMYRSAGQRWPDIS